MNIQFPLSYLSEFLEEYPLYSKFGINQPAEVSDLNGLQFNFFCKNENEYHFFKLEPASDHNGIHTKQITDETSQPDQSASEARINFTELFAGTCQSCKRYAIKLTISGGTQREKPKYFLQKIGQYPAPENNGTKVPKEIFNFLNKENRELYMRGLKNLDMGYGAGAFVYFRKIAENEFERIIESVSNHYSTDSTRIADAFRAYNSDHQKSKLIEEISPYLPENLKKHGANILLVLHDAASIPVNELTEDECIRKSKDIDMLFRHLLKKINEKTKHSPAFNLK
jgi:hypothetical protein